MMEDDGSPIPKRLSMAMIEIIAVYGYDSTQPTVETTPSHTTCDEIDRDTNLISSSHIAIVAHQPAYL